MINFYFIFLIAGIFTSILVILLLQIFGKKSRLPNIMLSVALLAVAWYAMMSLLIFSGQIQYFPNLYYKGHPLYYIFAPCCYLYVKFLVSPGRGIKRKDWIHLIPVVLAIIDTLPYILEDFSVKQHLMNLLAKDHSLNFKHTYGFINSKWHYFIRGVLSFLYLGFQWKIFIAFLSKGVSDKNQIRWIFSFNTIVSVLNLALAIMIVEGVWMDFTSVIDKGFFPLFISFAMILFGSILFFWPEYIYGLKNSANTPMRIPIVNPLVAEPLKETKQVNFSQKELSDTIRIIDESFANKKLYKEQGLTINKLAERLDISPRYLSWLLNNHYKLRFNDFINNYRVAYIKQQIESGALKNITLEALASEAGFSSRSTFYNVFKKNTGLSPAEFMSGDSK